MPLPNQCDRACYCEYGSTLESFVGTGTVALKVVVRGGKEEEKSSREGERVWSSLASHSGPEDSAGAEERKGGHDQRLRDEAGQILRVRDLLPSSHNGRETPRRSAVRLRGPPVLQWGRFQLWTEKLQVAPEFFGGPKLEASAFQEGIASQTRLPMIEYVKSAGC